MFYAWRGFVKGLFFFGCPKQWSNNKVCSKFSKLCIYLSRCMCRCNCFTYVTKTIANLTTYSRKPGDYNGTIIFENDIMTNSSPLNFKIHIFRLCNISFLLDSQHSQLSFRVLSKQKKQPKNLWKIQVWRTKI